MAMKEFKDLRFEKVSSLYGITKYVAEESLSNGYTIKVYKTEFNNDRKRSIEVRVFKDGTDCKDLTIKKMAYNITDKDVTDFMEMIQSKRNTLSTWEKLQIERANKSKPVKFNYRVVDCEHCGDVRYARKECDEFCRKHGGKVIREYWDEEDCGEGFITCEFPFEKVEEVFLTGFFVHDFYQW